MDCARCVPAHWRRHPVSFLVSAAAGSVLKVALAKVWRRAIACCGCMLEASHTDERGCSGAGAARNHTLEYGLLHARE
eukprot:2807522-Amphidinium_carterae.1